MARSLGQRLRQPRHLTVAVALASARPVGGGGRGVRRKALGGAGARRPAGRPRRPRGPVRLGQREVAVGAGAPARVPPRDRRGEPRPRSGLQPQPRGGRRAGDGEPDRPRPERPVQGLSLIHISEPTRLRRISYAVFCLKKKTKQKSATTCHTARRNNETKYTILANT